MCCFDIRVHPEEPHKPWLAGIHNDMTLQKSEHIEKFLEFAREPQLLGRFRQRLAEYKRFWVDVQAVSRATLQNSPRGAAVE